MVRRYRVSEGHFAREEVKDRVADYDRKGVCVCTREREQVHVPEDLRAEIEASMASYPEKRSALIPALHAAQKVHGWCSPEAIEQVACVMQITPGEAAAVATFYDMFETKPVGRERIYVCTNISCSLRGADQLLVAMKEAAGDDPDFNIRGFECLGERGALG